MKNSKLNFIKSMYKSKLFIYSEYKSIIILIVVFSCISVITSIVTAVFYKLYLKEKQMESKEIELESKGELKMVEIEEVYNGIDEFNHDTDEIELHNDDLT